jgi:hypothetical protein
VREKGTGEPEGRDARLSWTNGRRGENWRAAVQVHARWKAMFHRWLLRGWEKGGATLWESRQVLRPVGRVDVRESGCVLLPLFDFS